MPSFITYDGGELTYNAFGSGQPLVCLPGGPLRASRYLGNLGGLDAHRQLVFLELPPRRVDQIVDDVEALRKHVGRERVDILAHSASANLALLYAAAYPDRINKLVLITPGMRAVDIQPTEEESLAALERRRTEPWYPTAREAEAASDAGDDSFANRLKAMPFLYGRWDAAAQAHAAAEAEEATPGGAAIYYASGAFNPDETRRALTRVAGEVLVLVGELDADAAMPKTGAELAALFSHARLAVQSDAGHFPWLDDPEEFRAIVVGFLND